jgi:ubiquitin-protein ligase E3 C
VVREGFNPEAGLFKATTDNRLYPNPHAQLVAANALRLIEFLGRMLGKAMYEGILVELPLAPFFLKKFRGAYCDINDLPTLDPELYRNLVFLKRYTGDVAELGLTFTITDNVLGVAREVELAPRGHDTPVTADNRLAYIHRVADYRLNRQIREPAAAFLRGLHDLIKPEWVRMFNEEELQMLISGGQQGLDIADMRAHVQYSGGYHEEHPVILEFWRALATFSPQEQADFLRFVTSCPRPPLLGFRYLEPPLAIQLAGSMLDEQATERLPTAATCMNV